MIRTIMTESDDFVRFVVGPNKIVYSIGDKYVALQKERRKDHPAF